MSYPLPEKPKPEKRKRRYGWVTTTILVVLTIGLVGAGALFYALGSVSGSGPRQKELVVQILSSITGQPVTVAQLRHFALMPDVVYDLSNLSWSVAGGGQAQLEDMRLRMSFWGLMRGNPVLHDVTIKNLTIPAGAMTTQVLQIDQVALPADKSDDPYLTLSGFMGNRKLYVQLILDSFLDALDKPYYKLPNEVPIKGNVGDLEFSALWQRSWGGKLENIKFARRGVPDDVVTAELSWQRTGTDLVLKGHAKSTKSDLAFILTVPTEGPSQLRINGEKADWDDVYGRTTLSTLRTFLTDLIFVESAQREIMLGNDITLRCGEPVTTTAKEIHARLLQNCINNP